MRLRADELARFHEDGFPILPEPFSAAELGALKRRLPALMAERRPENFREKRPDHQHHRDLTPVTPLAEDRAHTGAPA